MMPRTQKSLPVDSRYILYICRSVLYNTVDAHVQRVAVLCHPGCTLSRRELSTVLTSAAEFSEGAVHGAAGATLAYEQSPGNKDVNSAHCYTLGMRDMKS